ncbi:transcription elongation factor b polypeptide 3 [Holotrichia oblita]|uniref:Transcription elongation factor b polypeptide 3 n=1 Tax=Holotrichia oblita TaxID=644536 RepID=A0ACB9ST88_HOLOL|nr:transcription elongation factor b polypeptide 3 [Holotrichia oblita]
MPVTVKHLEKTGIGRTVNSLRKLGGEVEDAAKTLVKKWKDMVSGNDEADESDSKSNGTSNTEETESNSSHKHSDKYRNSDRKERSSKDDKYKHNKEGKYDDYRHQSTSESKHKSSSSKYGKPENDRNLYESKDEEDNESGVASESEQSSSEEEEVESVVSPKINKYERDGKKSENKEVRHKESSSERTSKYKRDSDRDRKRERSRSKEKTRKRESRTEHEQKKSQKSDSSSSDSEHVSREYSSSSKSNSSKRKHSDSTSDEDVKKKLTKKSPTQNSHRSSNSHRSKDSSEPKRESKSNVDENSHKSSSHKSRESSSSSSSRDKKENKPDFDKKESSSSSKNDLKYEKRKSESSRDDRSKTENDRSKKESSSSKSDRKHTNNEKLKHKSSSKSSSSSTSSKMVDIGSESGTSFAEALGMLEPPASKSNKKFKSTPETSIYKVERPEKDRFKDKVVIEKPFKSDKIDIVIPPPPPKVDIDINISSLLPPITPNYRPVSNPILDNCSTRSRIMNDDEALSLVMTQKNMRTKVYSGNKCFFGTVPTLFELCIRILQDNIDALEYTGGVPYAILKPIIDKATPDQLFMLEHHNPYLIEDTDEIWKFHCQKEFRNKKREELESWREMYMRCLDEREAKLKALTENIKLAQDKSIPVRQTKLAYVDSVVKPPRDVIRKQVKSGFIDKKPIVTPSSRLSSLAAAGAAGQVVVPSPVRASSSSKYNISISQLCLTLKVKLNCYLFV